jgi:hypothetical protein
MATGDVPPPTLPDPAPSVDLGPIGPKQRYEFTKDQEAVIGDLSGKMRFVGAFLFALGVLGLFQVGFIFYRVRLFAWITAINALIYAMIGFWTLRASGAFSAVVETVGWDVPHLMDALKSMRKMYSLLYWLLIMAIVASIILFATDLSR